MPPSLSFKYAALAFGARMMFPPIESTEVTKARRVFGANASGPARLVGTLPKLAKIEDSVIAGVPVRRYTPVHAEAGTIVYFHGGGWVLGSIDSHHILAASLAASTLREVVSVDYRLAPEHAYPAALEDALAVTQALATGGKVVVAGDSAGGNLAAAVANVQHVDAQLLFYPVTDCVDERPSYAHYATGHILTREAMRYFRRTYVPDPLRRSEGGASPLRAEVLSSAPAYFVTAACDVLRDEGVAYAERLRAAGVPVTVDEVAGTPHGFMSLLGVREGREALQRTSAWVRGQLAS